MAKKVKIPKDSELVKAYRKELIKMGKIEKAQKKWEEKNK